jgi:hypothetical protein
LPPERLVATALFIDGTLDGQTIEPPHLPIRKLSAQQSVEKAPEPPLPDQRIDNVVLRGALHRDQFDIWHSGHHLLGVRAVGKVVGSEGKQDMWSIFCRRVAFAQKSLYPPSARNLHRHRQLTSMLQHERFAAAILPVRRSARRLRGYRTARARCRRRLARSFALRRAARSLVREWREAACFILSIGLLLERRRVAGDREHSPDPLTWLAPRDGFEPSTQRLTAACSTTELPGIRARSRKKRGIVPLWRPEAESNRCTRICSPLHSHSAIRPVAGADIGVA